MLDSFESGMKRVTIYVLTGYKKNISPVLERIFGHACRYTPTCSEYSAQAIEKFGILKGAFLSLKRIAKCNPLFEGGYDPLPTR